MRSAALFAFAVALAAACPAPAFAGPQAREPEFKLTLAAYRAGGHTSYDANLRKKIEDFVVWIGGYASPRGDSQTRAGGEYDFARPGVLVVPSLQTASNGFVQGSVYSELGGSIHAILGYSRTNLKEYFTLAFDPNDSVQIGLGGTTPGGARLDLFTVADVRLGTGQQDTHLFWRRRVAAGDRVTMDLVYKSGHAEDGVYVRAVGATATFDFPRWFVRAAYDPDVNFSRDTMVRVGGGWRF